MELSYLPANQAFVFTLGDSLIRMDGEPMFFPTATDATDAATRHNLTIDRWGYVTTVKRELVNH